MHRGLAKYTCACKHMSAAGMRQCASNCSSVLIVSCYVYHVYIGISDTQKAATNVDSHLSIS
jgi:hypothetical protein